VQPGLPRQAASSAIPDMVAFALAEGVYKTCKTVATWANEVYERSWGRNFPNKRLIPPINELIKNVSWILNSFVCALAITKSFFVDG
jgi:hypothetical protein